MSSKTQDGKFALCLTLTIFGVFLTSMALKDLLYPRHIIVDKLPVLSGFHDVRSWDVAKDPWVKDATVRAHMGLKITRLKPFNPIAQWGDGAFMREDGEIIQTHKAFKSSLPRVKADKMYADSLYPLVLKAAKVDKAAHINVSQVGTLSLAIFQDRIFIFGRNNWLNQWQKMQTVLKKYPSHSNMQYDMRYADGVAMSTIGQNA